MPIVLFVAVHIGTLAADQVSISLTAMWDASMQADELRDRLSDVDRTNSDASASEAAAISDQQISTTTRFGLEASGGSAGLRHSSSLKRTREADESMPLALRLDVLAGPALETSYRTDIGISEVTY